jgi:hypothetical protein
MQTCGDPLVSSYANFTLLFQDSKPVLQSPQRHIQACQATRLRVRPPSYPPTLPHLTLSSLQFNDNFSTKTDGGVLVYYVSAQPGKITAFKPVRRSKSQSFHQY